ncbi:hypothetical protein NPIL_548081 [Nephila pilipes]|uniref:Uncharacterized protein n=1 Tax=Nephila pilipes TaxID=299642 RepID=A0A8X6U6U8_NEPPI|nr:hypothetical protein NPIL_548081 [Nephila pilipes]
MSFDILTSEGVPTSKPETSEPAVTSKPEIHNTRRQENRTRDAHKQRVLLRTRDKRKRHRENEKPRKEGGGLPLGAREHEICRAKHSPGVNTSSKRKAFVCAEGSSRVENT